LNVAHSLVQQLYSPQLKEFYETTALQDISQEAFLWVCEMAKYDPMRINPSYPESCLLNSYIDLSTSLCNLMLTDFGSYTTVKFENELQEVFVLQKQPDKTFSAELFVKADPLSYPSYDGNITVYEVNIVIARKSISINTLYTLLINHKYTELSNGMRFEVNISFETGLGKDPLLDSSVYGELYLNDLLLNTFPFTTQHLITHSYFSTEVQFTEFGNYTFDLYLNDPYRPASPVFLGSNSTLYESKVIGESQSESSKNKLPTPEINNGEQVKNAFPIMITMITAPSVVAVVSDRMKRKSLNGNGNKNGSSKPNEDRKRKGIIK
jgi:hypothetical protein